MDPQGPHGILQTRILEWVALPSPGDLPNPGIEPRSPALWAILYQLSRQGPLRACHQTWMLGLYPPPLWAAVNLSFNIRDNPPGDGNSRVFTACLRQAEAFTGTISFSLQSSSVK